MNIRRLIGTETCIWPRVEKKGPSGYSVDYAEYSVGRIQVGYQNPRAVLWYVVFISHVSSGLNSPLTETNYFQFSVGDSSSKIIWITNNATSENREKYSGVSPICRPLSAWLHLCLLLMLFIFSFPSIQALSCIFEAPGLTNQRRDMEYYFWGQR